MSKYFGRWNDHASMVRDWGKVPDDFPTDEEIIFASYGGASYEGDAQVVFMRDGKLFEANGSHCSCYGLSEQSYRSDDVESQWAPEETSFEALQMQARASDANDRWKRGYDNCYRLRSGEHEPEAIARFFELFGGESLNV